MLSKNKDQAEIAAALALSRTAAQLTSRFRDIEKNVEAISVINSEAHSPKLLPCQPRH